MLEEGEFYVVVCEGRFRGLVGRYRSDENGWRHGMSFPGRESVSFLPRDLRPATNAQVGRLIRECDLEVLIP
jgi:hypothetical protein